MPIHLYAQCWNDEWMLPFFFRHYDGLVDRYVIYDDGSTDGTRDILRSHPRVELREFVRSSPDSFVLSERALSDECWKESRGEADWVIVLDVDEHVVHPDLARYLAAAKNAGVTLLPALGFQMISDVAPGADETLVDVVDRGTPFWEMTKPCIFDPNAIAEIGFAVGRHTADPEGDVVVPLVDEIQLRHYKFVDFERTVRRQRQLELGLGSVDADNGWGSQYSLTIEELRGYWDDLRSRAVGIPQSPFEASRTYPKPLWWWRYPTAPVRFSGPLDVDRVLAESDALGARLAATRDDLHTAEAELDETRAQLVAARHQLTQIVESKSWRLTAPLRRLASGTRKRP